MKIMEDLTPRKGQYVAAPICLLYVNSSQQLVPIAIQCKQGKEGVKTILNPVFVPRDNWIDWLLAKIYYQSAHAQVCSYVQSRAVASGPAGPAMAGPVLINYVDTHAQMQQLSAMRVESRLNILHSS